MLKNDGKKYRSILILLSVAFMLRLGIGWTAKGYIYDVNCFLSWARRAALETGFSGFYSPDYFCDYPPAYLYVLWFMGKVIQFLHIEWTGKGALMLLITVPALGDCLIAFLIYLVGKRRHGEKHALWFAGAAAFEPALFYDTAIWKQVDGVFALFLLICFLLLEMAQRNEETKRWQIYSWLGAAGSFGVALAIKPQALLAGPVLAICFLQPILCGTDWQEKWKRIRLGLGGTLCALFPGLVCALPFYGVRGLVSGLYEKYFISATSYPYASLGAFNFMGALGGNWKSQEEQVVFHKVELPFSWQQQGIFFLILLTLLLLVLAIKAQKKGCFSPLVLASVYYLGIYTFSHRMHERYVIPGMILLLGAAAWWNSRHLLMAFGGLSFISFLNLAAVYTYVDGEDAFLTSEASVILTRIWGSAETVLFLLLLFLVWRWSSGTRWEPLLLNQNRERFGSFAKQPGWEKKELIFVLGLTAVTALISFAGLGDLKAPQRGIDANEGSCLVKVTVVGEADQLLIYPGISIANQGQLTVRDDKGRILYEQELNYVSPFCWRSALLELDGEVNWYEVELSEGEILELAWKDAEGNILSAKAELLEKTGTITAVEGLCDEPDLVPSKISYKNSFYFDEVYHARTGYELLHGMKVYETTHPPFGKDLIALGISIFGMTGFGWRFFGVLFGVLMVPLLYLFVRRLTGKRKLSAFCAMLLSLDFMRYTQSRIATIDTYVVFFILLGSFCILWYSQTALQKGVGYGFVPLSLGGAAFGMACATKWTGFYAGAGFAVLFFVVLFKRYRQLCPKNSPMELSFGLQRFQKEAALAIFGGVLFYVLVPFLIYMASYLPYLKWDSDYFMKAWWNGQRGMLSYHAGLEATHPFSSPWFSWLLDLRPVWYYMGSGAEEGFCSSIAGFFHPLICWCGLAAMLRLIMRFLQGFASRKEKLVLGFWLVNLLPWVLVTRCTFLYHYFPCLPFMITAIALWLEELAGKHKKMACAAGGMLILLSGVLFCWFFPVLSGMEVPKAWADSLQWISSWKFY